MSWSWATFWPVPVSRIQKSLQSSAMIPSCQLGNNVSLPWVIYYEALYLYVVSSFSYIPVICLKLVLILIPLQFVYSFCNLSQDCPAVFLMYFIPAAIILLASLILIVQVSLPYYNTGRTSVLYKFIIVFLRDFVAWTHYLKCLKFFEKNFRVY
jgi:hypothetical protein